MLQRAAMRRFLCVTVLGAFGVLVSTLSAACASGPNEVKASSYDQSCSANADCVLVAELSVDDDCFMTCVGAAAVSKRAETDYRRDLEANARQCERIPGLDCPSGQIDAECVQGRCASVPKK